MAACRKYFPGKYPAPNTDCDEYPFASTLEGAANWGNFRNYVVKPIGSKDNQDAGTQLGEFYAEQRILGDNGINDPFYVAVRP
ncbi:NucA/NucB deoxyribonuclease domain-containing protein [Streptomyces sp. NPDC020917]|uniref:NucA/NucB deoxyribonuclease domain-containing protein n=1 Tax=Streptomyces sp. NPDC020917 TaxID=3365102 RepID=UPI003792C0CA